MINKTFMVGSLLSGVLVAAVAACSSSTSTDGNGTVGRISVSRLTDTLVVGDTVRLTAAPTTVDYFPVHGKTVTWSSLHTSVATVDNNGLVTAVAVGTDTVTATVDAVSQPIFIEVVAP